jgi:hypothetical protein
MIDRKQVTTLIRVKTRPLVPHQDNLWDALNPALPPYKKGMSL